MKKLGKVLCLSSALLLSTAAQAAWEANWLVGVSGAWGERSGNLNVDLEDSLVLPPAVNLTSFGDDVDDSGWIWGVLGGYQARCNGLLFGAEISVDWSDHDDSHNIFFQDIFGDNWASNASYDRDAIVALSARFGYELTSFLLPYLRAGIETSRDKLNYNGIDITQNGAVAFNVDGSRRVWRFLGGVGLEVPFAMFNGLSLRGEYNFHSRGRAVEADGTANDAITFVNAESKQHANSAKVSLVWNIPA